MRISAGYKWIAVSVGGFLIASGIVLNVWSVGTLMSPDGSIDSKSMRIVIWVFDFFIIILGSAIIHYRDRMRISAATKRNLLFLFVASILSLFLAEAALRLLGFHPWQSNEPDTVSIRVDPGGRFSVAHPTLGHTTLPGRFSVTLADGYSFTTTHPQTSSRTTHPMTGWGQRDSTRLEVWIFGCSFTYGWGVNDEQTYPWILQKRLPEYEILNFGMSGYGTLQSFIQFREALLEGRAPKYAVLAYASFHDARNTFSRSWRKLLALYDELSFIHHPYAAITEAGELLISTADVEYREFPMMHILR